MYGLSYDMFPLCLFESNLGTSHFVKPDTVQSNLAKNYTLHNEENELNSIFAL